MPSGNGGARGTWTRFLFDWHQDWGRRDIGSRWIAGILGSLLDHFSVGVRDAVLGTYHKNGDKLPAYDALRLLGNSKSMPQYATETWPQYLSRLQTDWSTWDTATSEGVIVDQLALAGAPGAQIIMWHENDSWSEFIVFYPAGSHPVTGYKEYGAGHSYGDTGLIYGPDGITAEQLSTYKDLITHWKGVEWKCPWLIWEVSGSTYGTGHIYGEAGLVYGGEQVRTKVQ